MTDSRLESANVSRDDSDESPIGTPPQSSPLGQSVRSARLLAIIASVFGVLLTLSLPFLPVEQDSATLTWPQNGSTGSVEAPLVSYAPLSLDVQIPCSAVGALADRGGVLTSTAPAGAADAGKYGLVARVNPATPDGPAGVEVQLRNKVLLSSPLDQLPADCALVVSSDSTRTTAGFVGVGEDAPTVVDGDLRPQMVGIFSDLDGAVPDGLRVTAQIDSRFSSTPSTIKFVAMVVGALATILALVALHRLDNVDGRRARRFLPTRWWSFGAVDAVVLGTLMLWHFIGASTSDDGYQFNMARTSEAAGYMANYFRWYGVPEAPFGSPYYDVLAVLANITPASPFVRLPALLAGIVAWLVISREVAPRLGAAVRGNRLALWTGGLVFLAFWLPYNNGLRPEPIVAVGVLLTWCSVERAVATRRLLPAAVAILVGAATLTAGPSGLICFGALVAGARPILQIVIARAKTVGYVALLAPLVASGTVILVAVFADQTLAAVMEMQHVHAIGPNVPWFDEYLRYQYLLNISVDGSLSRRFGVFAMVLSIAVTVLVMLRKGGRIPGTAAGPSRRLIGITLAAMGLMMFTPTKWTHHFGIYAGLAGSLAVLASVAVSTAVVRSPRNRALFAAAVLFLLAMCFTSTNGWWYVSSYSVPWWDKPVSIAGLGAGTILLGATLVMLLIAAWCYFREPYTRADSVRRRRLWAIPPLTVAAAAMVLFEVLSMAKGAVAQYPAFSLARSNVDAVTGAPCGLANDVLLETDPNASLLQPLSGDAATALAGTGTVGFTPNGVAGDLSADEESSDAGVANSVKTDNTDQTASSNAAGTGGGAGAVGVNGSAVALPFGLDPDRTPVLGSDGSDGDASLTTGWYRLPNPDADAGAGDIVSIAAAGRIHSVDADGVVTYGQNLEVEYGTTQPDGAVGVSGRVTPIDIGPAPSWRNLRVPLDSLPDDTDVIRLVASDSDSDPQQWLAVTPPRVPRTQTLNDVIGSDAPVMIDWAVGLAFPCQRPFDHRAGVAEAPEYRILPDRPGAIMTSLWQDRYGGGPLGWIEMTRASRTIPSYLRDDWDRDWGGVEQYSPLDPGAKTAEIDTTRIQRSGLWNPAPIITAY
ncbi:putative arabinosyltransferase [Rhodococcus wratislaviensis NBRC 100605]|uniref:Putative arabinosyltransferase n=1 Tax=Rhodococcus wratislaviensis NBRC 100605 TaxID=1219028 RepID=X0QVT8_RHOWR|nr:putative arabinosyltransferase [Rhodococcus wratislaviensis NBRC 100605]